MSVLFGVIVILIVSPASFCKPQINLDLENTKVRRFHHFWKSTGLCPLDPKNQAHKYLLSSDEKINLALIAALPHNGIKYVRIHWLLNLIIGPTASSRGYNFTYLDELMDFMHGHGLKPGFEIMGWPVGDDLDAIGNNSDYWKNLVEGIVGRYIGLFCGHLEKYGARKVSSWRFETWNEPDLKSYNLLNFTLKTYLGYVQGCAEGLKSAFRNKNTSSTSIVRAPRLVGPAGLFRDSDKNHPLCWGLLRYCDRFYSKCPIDLLSFHRKGNGSAEGVVRDTLQLASEILTGFPRLRKMPLINDESDMAPNWSRSLPFRADVTYPAMAVRLISSLNKLRKVNLMPKIEAVSLDNAFLSYNPDFFTQRTLLARFQMNRTNPPHRQFIKKPVYAAMALLSLLGNEQYLGVEKEHGIDERELAIIATRCSCSANGGANQSAIILARYWEPPEGDDDFDKFRYLLGDRNYKSWKRNKDDVIKEVELKIRNAPLGGRYVVYLMDNERSNPYGVWAKLGEPVFPDARVRKMMRQVEEPERLVPPLDITSNNLTVDLKLKMPSIAFVHICARSDERPGKVTKLKIFNVTGNEVMLTWSDKRVKTKCIRTYEVEFEPLNPDKNATTTFRRINLVDTIFLSHHFVAGGPSFEGVDVDTERTVGRYRVRAVDFWDRPGIYSGIVIHQ